MKIFQFIEELNCFVVNPDYKEIANKLGLNEWNEVVWVGRYFALDNDYGEHWFDNWIAKDNIQEKAEKLGYNYDDLLVIDPERLQNKVDGPCHSNEERKLFWTDVLKSLDLSLEIIFNEAKKLNSEREENDDEEFIIDLDEIIKEIKASL